MISTASLRACDGEKEGSLGCIGLCGSPPSFAIDAFARRLYWVVWRTSLSWLAACVLFARLKTFEAVPCPTAPTAAWPIPVSYTHLDVYKRQILHKTDGCKAGISGKRLPQSFLHFLRNQRYTRSQLCLVSQESSRSLKFGIFRFDKRHKQPFPYPFNPPTVAPAITCFWKIIYTATGGIIASTTPAHRVTQSALYLSLIHI